MRTFARLTVVGLGLAAFAMAGPAAYADPRCAGTAEDGRVCVDADNVPTVVLDADQVGRCVFLPTDEDECEPLFVGVPGTEGGDLYRIVYVES